MGELFSCKTAGCVEPAIPGDTLCDDHAAYVRGVVAFIDGSAPGMDFDTGRETWRILLEEFGVTVLPIGIDPDSVSA